MKINKTRRDAIDWFSIVDRRVALVVDGTIWTVTIPSEDPDDRYCAIESPRSELPKFRYHIQSDRLVAQKGVKCPPEMRSMARALVAEAVKAYIKEVLNPAPES